ncbi:DEAD/DEAH box helicase [Gordonia sp. CPCC 205515]|uniref:DEAD/DEAH box helicase n=1 Tax=Gordonia sp. CPCC 205515 TaxID=3140791 RepID=UPI003AF3C578
MSDGGEWVKAEQLLPAELRPYLNRFDALNPLQAAAVPAVLGSDRHLMVVAPTSSGKTLVGEVAALRSILLERKPAVWLLPARALAGEIAATTARWRQHGITSLELTGETNMSSAHIRRAQLWVATTEKFEALYRRSSLREHLDTIGCLIVDEVHLVGDVDRGATLESLIARLRSDQRRTRIVALSATASNAGELAAWFNAELIRTDWRPTVLTTEVVPFDDGDSKSEYEAEQEGKDQALTRLVAGLDDSGSLLVFCGSKLAVRRTAALLAGLPFHRDGDEQVLAESAFAAGVGMHYRDAPQAARALRAFNARQIPMLVATTGLSTGVNTPARVVVIRDLVLGLDSPLEVSQAQQMLGRAGRAGQESHGYGYVLVPRHRETEWRAKLDLGYTVRSQVRGQLADVLLAEILLGSITDRASAESWFRSTFAYAQTKKQTDLGAAITFLVDHGLVADADGQLGVTEIGALTTRLMIDAASAGGLRQAITSPERPLDADDAERIVLEIVVNNVAPLHQWPVNPRLYRTWADDILYTYDASAGFPDDEFGPSFALAAALAAVRDPARIGRNLPPGATPAEIRRVIDTLPRYLSWAAALGYLGEGDWAPAVAGDLARRLTWWHLSPHPERGAGRLLWFLERLLDPENRRTGMPDLYRRARRAGFDTPDRIHRSPRGVDVSPEQFDVVAHGRAVLDIEPPEGLVLEHHASPVEARLTVLTTAGPFRDRSTAVPAPRSLPLPHPSSPVATDLAADVFVYTRDGDFAYQNLVTDLPVDEEPAGRDPVEAARDLLTDLEPTPSTNGGGKRRGSGKRRRTLAELLPHAAPDPHLADVAAALAPGRPDAVTRAATLRINLGRLLPVTEGAARGPLRAAATVLVDGTASAKEFECVYLSLAGALGLHVGAATTFGGRLVALLQIEGDWYVATPLPPGQSVTGALDPPTIPVGLRSLPGIEFGAAPTAPACDWMGEFAPVG